MIYPVTLYNFGKVCKSSLAAGNVLRALCKQAVKLTPEEETIFAMIQNDSGWMDERVEQQRERWKERQRKSRMSRNVTVTKCDTRDTHNVTMPSSLPPSKNNTIQDSTKHLRHNTTRSVAVRAHARGDADGNGDVNGGFLVGGGRSQLMVDARAFADDVHGDAENGGNAFFDPRHDPAVMIVAMTGDAKSIRRWRQLAAEIPDADLRQELYTFYRETRAGEEPRNRAAALNARLGKLCRQDADKGRGGK